MVQPSNRLDQRGTPGAERTVWIAVTGTMLALVSYCAPIVTVRPIAFDLGAGPAGQSWILSSMSLGLTAMLLTAGTLADEFGRRRVFVAGALALGASSILGALAPSALIFVIARVLQGVGAAAIIACSLALISHAVPAGPQRVRASGLWGAGLGAGIALGPLLAGLVAWQPYYAGIGVLAFLVAGAGQRLLAESTSGQPRPVDLPGMILLSGGLTILLVGLTGARQLPLSPPVVAALIMGAALLVGFVLAESRSPHPMAALSLFANPALVAATLGSLASGLGVIALTSYLPTLLQRTHGMGPLATALLSLAWSGTGIVTAVLTRHLSDRISSRWRLAGGLLLTAVGTASLAWLDIGTALWVPAVALTIAGAATGVVNATLGRAAVASVPAHRAAMGSGINNTTRYLGAAVGVTIVSVVTSPAGAESPVELIAGWRTSVLIATGLLLACVAGIIAARERG